MSAIAAAAGVNVTDRAFNAIVREAIVDCGMNREEAVAAAVEYFQVVADEKTQWGYGA